MKLATDIGGTFTDLVYLNEETGGIGTTKVSSTPPNATRLTGSRLTPSGGEMA